MEINQNDPRYCGACEHVHPLGEVDCGCYCDRVDCKRCGPRIAARVMAPELAREIDKYYQVFEETSEDQRIASVSEIILGHRCPAPPEPREPATREGTQVLMEKAREFYHSAEWRERWNYADPVDKFSYSDDEIATVMGEFALAYSAELRAERDKSNLENAGLRLYIHRIEQHNQYFERCESAWCNPGPDSNRALEIVKGLEAAKQAAERSLLQARSWVARLWELGEFTGACGSALGEDGELAEILRLASTSAPEGT